MNQRLVLFLVFKGNLYKIKIQGKNVFLQQINPGKNTTATAIQNFN